MAPPPPPKRKTAEENFHVPGLDLEPGDLPTKDNQSFQTVLFAPVFCPRESSRQLKYRLNVAVILRAFDYFYEFRNNDDFWSCLRYVMHKLWKPAHVQQIANRYIEARRRHLKRTGGRSEPADGINLTIINIADKLIANEDGPMSQVNYPPTGFDERARRWTVEARDVYAILEPFKRPAFPYGGSPFKPRQPINSSPRPSAFSPPPKSEVSESGDDLHFGNHTKTSSKHTPLNSWQHPSTAPIQVDSPFGSRPSLASGPPPPADEADAWEFPHPTPPIQPSVIGSASALPPTDRAQRPPSPHHENGKTPEVRSFSILGAANNAADSDTLSMTSKRPATSNEPTPDPKRRAMDSYLSGQVHLEQPPNSSAFGEVPALADTTRPSFSTTLSIDTINHPVAASPRTPGPVSGITKSFGSHTPILPNGASPMQSPSTAPNAEIRQLQSACAYKDQHAEQLQRTITILNNSLEQKTYLAQEERARLEKDRSDLAAKLQAAEEKIAAMAATIPPSTPTAWDTSRPRPKDHENTLEQAQYEQYIARKDYKGLLSHVAGNIPKLTDPVFQALKQEGGNESSAGWQALEAGWVALDWAKEQLITNANKL